MADISSYRCVALTFGVSVGLGVEDGARVSVTVGVIVGVPVFVAVGSGVLVGAGAWVEQEETMRTKHRAMRSRNSKVLCCMYPPTYNCPKMNKPLHHIMQRLVPCYFLMDYLGAQIWILVISQRVPKSLLVPEINANMICPFTPWL
jgi:hypothetical protein